MTWQARRPRVLVVEDEELTALDLTMLLEELGLSVCGTARNGPQALQMQLDLSPDLITMDVDLGGKAGGIAAATLIRTGEATPIIFVTGSLDPDSRSRMASFSGSAVVAKPFSSANLKSGIDQALQRAADA